jgi:cation transport regulator ChaB
MPQYFASKQEAARLRTLLGAVPTDVCAQIRHQLEQQAHFHMRLLMSAQDDLSDEEIRRLSAQRVAAWYAAYNLIHGSMPIGKKIYIQDILLLLEGVPPDRE